MKKNAGRRGPAIPRPRRPEPAGSAGSQRPDPQAVRADSGAAPAVFPAAGVTRPVPPRDAQPDGNVLAVILTCGDGTPLEALTRLRCTAALPFAGHYRNIDFTFSNCMNSGIHRIGVVAQFRVHALMQQLRNGWSRLWPEFGQSIELWPAQRHQSEDAYRGTVDATYQHLTAIEAHAPSEVLILGGDRLGRMNYAHMIDEHRRRDAHLTVGYLELPQSKAGQSDGFTVDQAQWVKTAAERPSAAADTNRGAERSLVSLGAYVFNTSSLIELLRRDAKDSRSWHDLDHDILPAALAAGMRVLGHPFRDAATGDAGCCRNVGTVDGYWLANMEQLSEPPRLDLGDRAWPIWTNQLQVPAARFKGRGTARESIVSAGCVLAGEARHSVLSVGCEVGAHTVIEDTVVLPGVRVGRGCRIRRAIVDADCVIDDGTVIDAESSSTTAGYVSPNGIVLVAARTATGSRSSARRGHGPSAESAAGLSGST